MYDTEKIKWKQFLLTPNIILIFKHSGKTQRRLSCYNDETPV